MQKQGAGKIDWTDYTWNPISGCEHNCPYCYLKRMEQRFKKGMMVPKYNPDRLTELHRIKKSSLIFTGSSGDMWGDWVDSSHIEMVLDCIRFYEMHTFQFLTKNPKRYGKFELPENAWYGTTWDGTKRTEQNIFHLIDVLHPTTTKFVSFEPLLANPIGLNLRGIDWVIVGADSTPGAKRPPMRWVDHLIVNARKYKIPVFVKDNYNYHTTIKEMPK